MNTNDPLLWHIAEALQQLGSAASPGLVAERVRQLQRGLPAEDEFSLLLTWLGRCRLVHKLEQVQTPRASRRTWRAPDLLAVFEYDGQLVPVLIEVKTTPFSNDELSWQPAYRHTLVRYAEMLNLPLLIAWRFGSLWTLVDIHQLRPTPRYKITFAEGLRHSLMTELAGDFSFSLRPGCGLHFTIHKKQETEGGFEGVIVEAYWQNAEGQRFQNPAGVFPLFVCLEQESIVKEEGAYITQSYVIPDSAAAEFASRALGTLLRLSTGDDEVSWRRALEEGRAAPFAATGLRKAADQALRSGFLQYGLELKPAALPSFLSAIRSRGDTQA